MVSNLVRMGTQIILCEVLWILLENSQNRVILANRTWTFLISKDLGLTIPSGLQTKYSLRARLLAKHMRIHCSKFFEPYLLQ